MKELPTMRFVFDRHGRATKEKKGLVQLEICHDGTRKWYSTGVKVFKDQWDDRLFVINSPQSVHLNGILATVMKKASNYIISSMDGDGFTFEGLSAIIDTSDKRRSFFDFVEDRVERRPDITEGTRKHHRVLVKALRDHGKMEYTSNVNKANIIDFYEFVQRKNIRQTTVYNYIKNLKVYVNQAIDRGLISIDPFIGLKLNRGKNAIRVFLTEDEIRKLAGTEINVAPVAKARDLFVFQCYTGLSYADMMAFDYESDVEDRDGKKIVTSKRKKSGEEFYIVLMKPAIAILEKYGYRLPRMTNQKYNDYLKVAVAHAGINKNISSHSGRHSFAIMALNNGISMEVVARILGHADIRTTKVYAKVLNKSVEEAFAKLDK